MNSLSGETRSMRLCTIGRRFQLSGLTLSVEVYDDLDKRAPTVHWIQVWKHLQPWMAWDQDEILLWAFFHRSWFESALLELWRDLKRLVIALIGNQVLLPREIGGPLPHLQLSTSQFCFCVGV